METKPQTRRRKVKTCWECYRRKQKCNRAYPCNICISRNVPEKCSYSSSTSLGDLKYPHLNHGSINKCPRGEEIILKSSSTPSDLFGQVGYARHNNFFSEFQKSFHVNDELSTFMGTSSTTSLSHPGLRHKFLSLIIQLPSQCIISELINSYFSEVNWYFKVLEEQYFRNLLKSWQDIRSALSGKSDLGSISRDLQYFPALLFQVLAVSLQFLPPNTESSNLLRLNSLLDSDRLSHEYSKMGMEIMSLLGRHSSTLIAVEHDLMRSGWLKNYSRGTEAYHLLGSAIRQGQDLGLHLQASIPKVAGEDVRIRSEKLWYDEYKRRLWVTLFSWDSHMSVMLGRPRSINASDCTIERPIDCTFPADLSTTMPAATTLQDPQYSPSAYSPQLFQYSLAQKIHESLVAGAHKPHIKDYSLITNLHDQVISIIDKLPPTLQLENPDISWDKDQPRLPLQRQAIASAAYSFLMALHRPHAPIHAASRTASIKAALDCLHSQDQLLKLLKPNQCRIYSLSFNSIDCAIFLSGMVLESPNMENDLRGKIIVAIQKTIRNLMIMEERSPMAKTGVQILNICNQRILTRDNNGGIPNTPQASYQMEGAQEVLDERSHTITRKYGVSLQTENVLEAQQPLPAAINSNTALPDLDFHNYEMDISFWEEMNQMIDFDIGVSMEEDLWNPSYSFPGLDPSYDG